MKTLTGKDPRLIHAGGILACAAAAALGYAAGARPLLQREALAQAGSREVAAQRRKRAEAETTVRAARQQLDAALAAAAARPLRLESPSRINTRLSDLATLSTALGLQLQDLQPGAAERGDRYGVFPIRLAGRGSYRNCVRFMHDLRARFPDVAVSGFRLTGEPEGASGAATFDMDLHWYTAPLPASTATPP